MLMLIIVAGGSLLRGGRESDGDFETNFPRGKIKIGSGRNEVELALDMLL